MGPERCARCGRLPPEVSGSWASIEGEDVCPDCQTAPERRDIGLRVIEAIKDEIERRRRGDVPPDEVEGALVDYALSLREELEIAPDEAEPAPADRPEIPLQPSRRTFRVAMTAAFLTGHPLAVRIADYGGLQSDLAGALSGPGWRVKRLHAEGGTYASGGGFVDALPLVIARREGAELLGQLSYLLKNPGDARVTPIASTAPGFDVEPKSLSIDVYDLGVAVLTAWLDVFAPADVELPAFARAVKSLAWLRPGQDGAEAISQALQAIAHDTAEQYGRAVRTATPDSIEPSWLATAGVASAAPDLGRLLWLHPVHVLEAEHPSEQPTRALAPTFHQTIRFTDGIFAPGVGWSAIVTAPGSSGAATSVRLTQLHWAYYALYMEIDRGLLAVLNQGRWSDSATLKDVERDAEIAFSDYLRVMEARARLDSALSARGGDELAIWRVISDVQHFDAIVEAVERKIEVLKRLTERRVDQAAAHRARRVGNFLGGLSALTVLTVVIAVVGYFAGTKSGGVDEVWLAVAVVLGAYLVAIGGYWLVFHGRDRRRRARRR
jgi:hypothetical protein